MADHNPQNNQDTSRPPGLQEHGELVIQGGPRRGDVVTLAEPACNIGRHHESDLVVEDPSVSRKHAVIMRAGDSYSIRDLDSTNGTFLNGQRVERELPLAHGDSIKLGGTEFDIVFRNFSSGARTVKVDVVGQNLGGNALEVNPRTRQVYLNGELMDPPLPRKEFDLVALLADRRGEAVSRDDIALGVWPERTGGDVGNHEIEQCVHRVRARIESDTSNPKHLVTVRGYGYRLN